MHQVLQSTKIHKPCFFISIPASKLNQLNPPERHQPGRRTIRDPYLCHL